MARRVVFVTGGARSGKSRFAQRLVEAWEGPLLYVATAEIRDGEMAERVRRHQRERGERWETLDEPLDLVRALRRARVYGGCLVDCLTLWTANLMEACGGEEEGLSRALGAFLRELRSFTGRVCFVSNEVGSGIVPANPLARRFRDVAGRVNQEVAARADEAYLVVSGLALRLK